MEYTEREKLCYRIIAGFQIIHSQKDVYFVYDPTPYDLHLANDYYQQVYDKLISDGVPSEDIVSAILFEKKLYTKDDDIKMEDLQENLKKLRKRLPDLEFRSVEKKQVLSYIEATEKEIGKLQSKKYSLLQNTAEYIARLEKYKFLIFKLTKNENGKSKWSNFDKFKVINDKLINHLVNVCYIETDLNESKIREIARNEPWRSMWVSSVKTGNLFSRAMTEMTAIQRAIVSWSLIYDSVYESMETPPTSVIQDDKQLDAWLEQQHDKREQERNKVASTNVIPDHLANSQEVYVIAETPEDADKVYKLNDTAGMSIIRNREAVLNNKGSIKEQEMPDVKRQLQMQLNNAFREKTKGNAS